MLGWALNKATGNAPANAPPTPGPDDTFVEQPDTPAPVFAARAFKRALFGTPAAPSQAPAQKEDKTSRIAPDKSTKPVNIDSRKYESPSKPQGILLTPGTGTSRRKRVSFGRDVKSTAALGDSGTRPRTRLQEALENSRKQKIKHSGEDDARKLDFDLENIDGDDVWEEVDELDRDPDITVDLNEPRSQSGRYWKGEFQKYHDEARVEMEKLVKYKQLAKSYAKAKDAEALDLNERLREEQAKVVEMERKIAEMAETITTKQGHSEGSRDDRKFVKDLSRQTALAAQYRNQVEELETLLKDSGYQAGGRQRRVDSSRTTQRKELDELRQELQQVKSDLTTAKQRELNLETEKKKAAADLAKSTRKVDELERKLSRAEQDRQRKDNQYEKLKADYDTLKEKEKAQREEISNLKRGKRVDKYGDTDILEEDFKSLSTAHNAPTPWIKKLEDLQAKLKEEQDARRREMEDASVTIDQLRQEFRRASEFMSPARRKRTSDLRAKPREKLFKSDTDTDDILRGEPLAGKKDNDFIGRPVPHGSKRTASGKIVPGIESQDEKPAPAGRLRRLRSMKEQLQKTSSPRPQYRSGLKSQNHEMEEAIERITSDLLSNERDKPVPSIEAQSRTALSSERRAAAIARLEQKRAERRKTQKRETLPGKENLRLYEDTD